MSKAKKPATVFYPAAIIVRRETDGDDSYLLVVDDLKGVEDGVEVATYERVEHRRVKHTSVLEEI